METMPIRKLPVGIQDFTKLREENFLYVDKTALVYLIVCLFCLRFQIPAVIL